MIAGNTHFALATHVLTALAFNDGRLVTSATLAKSAGTNAAFLRAVMSRLREAGLIETKLGAGGGSTLAKSPRAITLLDVFRATNGNAELKSHDCTGANCAVAKKIPAILDRLESRLDDVLAKELRRVSIAKLVKEIES